MSSLTARIAKLEQDFFVSTKQYIFEVVENEKSEIEKTNWLQTNEEKNKHLIILRLYE